MVKKACENTVNLEHEFLNNICRIIFRCRCSENLWLRAPGETEREIIAKSNNVKNVIYRLTVS